MKLLNFWGKDYEKMDWKRLTTEARMRGLDQRLTTYKMAEGAGEADRIKIIQQLNLLDQAKNSNLSLIIAALSLLVSIIAIWIAIKESLSV